MCKIQVFLRTADCDLGACAWKAIIKYLQNGNDPIFPSFWSVYRHLYIIYRNRWVIFWKQILPYFENNSSISLSHIFVFKLGNKDQGINGPVKTYITTVFETLFYGPYFFLLWYSIRGCKIWKCAINWKVLQRNGQFIFLFIFSSMNTQYQDYKKVMPVRCVCVWWKISKSSLTSLSFLFW